MEFGKLPSVERVDFRLPAEPPGNALILSRYPVVNTPGIYLGATGYNMKPWVGKWYPAGAKDRDFLRHYGAQFNTIEHNTTHYRIPDEGTVRRWREETPADFRFCPKVPQTISHARDLGINGREIALFCAVIAGLEEKMGVCFIQLPPHFSPKDLAVLKRFLQQWTKEIPLAVEVRHPAFFDGAPTAEPFFDLLDQFNVATVITDVAGRRDVCHMRVTNPNAVVRFVGNGLHPSDYQRVGEWGERLKAWFEKGLEAVWFFTHEPDNLLAPELAAHCSERFKALMPAAAVRGPQQVGGIQGSLF